MLSYIKKNKILFLVLLFAFVIRIVGIFPGHPPNHPDEPMSFGSAIEMLMNNDLNPRRFDYPAGVPLLHFLFFKSIILPHLLFIKSIQNPDIFISSLNPAINIYREYSELIFGRNGIILLFWSRFLTAFLGTASVFLVYKIGQKLFNSHVGLISAFFLTFNYRHDLSSHLALSDIPNSFFVLLAFYACVLLLEKNTMRRYLFTGVCVGLSVSMKYQIFALFPFLFVQLIWIFKKKNIGEFFNKNFILSLTIVPVIFCLLNIYLLLNLETALPVIEYVGKRYGVGQYNHLNYYAIFNLYKWGIGPLPFLSIILGILVLSLRQFKKSLFLLSYVLVFMYVFLYYSSGGAYVRNFTTVIPLLMIFAGYGFYQLTLSIKFFNKKKLNVFLIVLLIFINLEPIKNSIILAKDYSRPWSRDVLDAWVEENMPEGSNVRNDNLGISSTISKALNVYHWEHAQENSIEELIDARDDFAVLNIAWHQIFFLWSDTRIEYSEILKYMDIPYRKLKDTYYNLALEEFKNYTIFETYKSWQAPEDSYFIIKVPLFPKDRGKRIKEFNFTENIGGWKFYDFSGSNTIEKIVWNDGEGSEEVGSLEMTADIYNAEFSRLISPFIKIIPGRKYLIEAYVKNGIELKENQRDGFFRIDVFNGSNFNSLSQGGLTTAVSGRIYGPISWKKKRILLKVPENGNYLTISFQRSSLGAQIPYFLDDIVVYEIKNIPNRFPKIPYVKVTMPDSTIFPIGIY
ncbi:MAG: glycosyltransferase family 39 protein [Candidatus Levybacteria bacterium]|nr:glycosyltransferase family 39 protein [Candidatus Levybacteria bacterium]